MTKLGNSGLIRGGPHEFASVGKRKIVGAEDILVRLLIDLLERILAEPNILLYVLEMETIRIHYYVNGE